MTTAIPTEAELELVYEPVPQGISLSRVLKGFGWLLRALLKRGGALAVFLLLWQYLPILGVVDRTFMPPFSNVAREWVHLMGNGVLLTNSKISLQRALAGLAISIAVGVPLGLLMGWYKTLADVLNPLLTLGRNTAVVALLPAFTLLLGIGETAKVVMVIYACFWPILLNTMSGVATVDPLLIKSARSLGLPPMRLFQKVILPSAVPSIFTGIRLAGAASILVLLLAEIVGAKAGLGYLITNAQDNFDITTMYAGIVTIAIIGLLLNAILVWIERYFGRWRATPSV